MPRSVDKHLQAIAAAESQFGVVSCSQLKSVGWTQGEIETQLEQGRWQRLLRGIYSTETGTTAVQAWWWAAHLHCGPFSALCDHSALQVWGLTPVQFPVQIELPWTKRVAPLPDIMETRRRREQRPSRSRNGNPPAVVAEHAVLDVIADLNASDKIEDLVTRACQQGATSYDRIERALASRARYRHRTMVSELLVDIRGGATSILEMRGVRRVLRAHGLPEGRGQVREYQNGKVVFRDREIDPYGLVLEFDGRRGHDDAAGRFRDMERDNHVTSTGRRTLRIGWRAVNELECETARSIADVLWNLGWRGQLTRCGTGCRAVG